MSTTTTNTAMLDRSLAVIYATWDATSAADSVQKSVVDQLHTASMMSQLHISMSSSSSSSSRSRITGSHRHASSLLAASW